MRSVQTFHSISTAIYGGTPMACHWREDNINIVEIKELLGHKSLQSAMIYQDVTEQQKKEAINTLEDTITKAMPKKWQAAANKDLIAYLGL